MTILILHEICEILKSGSEAVLICSRLLRFLIFWGEHRSLQKIAEQLHVSVDALQAYRFLTLFLLAGIRDGEIYCSLQTCQHPNV